MLSWKRNTEIICTLPQMYHAVRLSWDAGMPICANGHLYLYEGLARLIIYLALQSQSLTEVLRN